VTSLGADATRFPSYPAPTLPEGIESGHYALFVSTIEPRKGHRFLYRVWVRLLETGIPQAMRFKLVFVGRHEWMVDDLMHDLKSNPILGDTLQILSDVDDAQLATLYDGAAFCVFPSIYEGYGLPIVESFLRGKAVIASTGGAIPEVTGEFSPCLDPEDEDLWYVTLKKWIEDPAARRPFEIAIRERFRHPSWKEAAVQFFAILDEHEATSATNRDFEPPRAAIS
jgi:glycosyltransferase involved in cell wall biosynthesis